MGSFNKRESRGKFTAKRKERSEMYQAVCSECGKDCELPFKPRGDKPVYCSSCFEKKSNKNRPKQEFSKRRVDRPMYKAICDKCHKECFVPFKPSGDKAIYCDDCFSKNEKFKDQKNEDQFEILNIKLDKILKLLSIKEEKLSEKKILKKVTNSKKTVAKKAVVKKKKK